MTSLDLKPRALFEPMSKRCPGCVLYREGRNQVTSGFLKMDVVPPPRSAVYGGVCLSEVKLSKKEAT